MKIQGIINQPINFTLVPGMLGPKRWSKSSCKTFLGTEGKGDWQQSGWIYQSQDMSDSPGVSCGKNTGLEEEHWISFALILARFLT